MSSIAFTPWNNVKIVDFLNKREVSRKRFLLALRLIIPRSKKYGVFFDNEKLAYKIRYKGELYNVSFPPNVERCIKNRKKTNLTKEMDALVEITRRRDKKNDLENEKIERIEARKKRVQEIELSGYSELKTTEDYEIYLEYLNKKFKEAKTDEEKTLINAKIRGLLKAITNPYDLKIHLYGLICDVANEGKKLDDDKQAKLEEILRDIANDYYQKIVNKSGETLTLGSAIKPMDIIRRIESAEHLVRTWKEQEQEQVISKVEVIEPKPIQENDMEEDNLDEISDMLDTIRRGKR